MSSILMIFFFFQAEDGIRDYKVTGVQTCALPISGQASTPFGENTWPSTWHSLRCAAQAYEPVASTSGSRWVTQCRSPASSPAGEWPAQTSFPHDPHAPTSSDAKIAASSCAQAARCCPQTRRRDVSVRRRCGEQCTCPSTAHTALCAAQTSLPQLAHCVTSSTPTRSLDPPSQVRRHAVQRRRRPFGASAWLCSACRLQTTRPQLPHGSRHVAQAACPSSAHTPSCAVQYCNRHEGHTRACSSHAGCPSTRHSARPCSAQKSSAQTEQRCEQASQPQW